MLKYFLKVFIRNLLKIFWVLPIDSNKIYFQSFGGNKIACNPLYIYKYMSKNFPNFKYIWCVNDNIVSREKNVKYVKKNSLNWIVQIITSKVLITNDDFFPYIPYRKKTLMIDTWHGGGAYKKINKDFDSERNNYNSYKSLCYMSKYITYFISSSKSFTNLMSGARYIGIKKFLPIGMPRNDIFFDVEALKKVNIIVREKYGFKDTDFLVLYAPTYRGLASNPTYENILDIKQLRQIISMKFGKEAKILFRGHYLLKNNEIFSDYDLDVSEYNDMQELLCSCDLLITDYSSSMWDFSFLNRPCILFVPDFDEYNIKRGFYSDPNSWGFPICKTNDEVFNQIQNFDINSYKIAMKKHHELLGNYENGNATKKIVNIIIDNLR